MNGAAELYIVYVSTGEYSDYFINSHYVGNVDPEPILDAMTEAMSEGRWKKFTSKGPPYGMDYGPEKSHLCQLEAAISRAAVQELERNGFKKVEDANVRVMEVHV